MSPSRSGLADLAVDGEEHGSRPAPCEITRITLVSGTSTGRLVSMCGQMGVMQMRRHRRER